MKHATKQFLSLTAAGLVLATGCAAGPQRLPGVGAEGQGQKIASTTGDMDACAMALGNLEWHVGGPTTGAVGIGGFGAGRGFGGFGATAGPAGAATPGDTDRMPPLLRGNAAPHGERAAIPWTTGNHGNALTGGLTGANNQTGAALDAPSDPATVPIMANGVLIGNIALVALPDDETTPPAGAGAPAGGAGAAGGGAMAPGGMAGRTVTGAGAAGFTGSPGAVGTAPGATGLAGPTGLQAGAAGTGIRAGAGAAGAGAVGAGAAGVGPEQSAGSSKVALDRIVASCGRLAQVRTVAEGDDEVRMAEITGAIRLGTPITEFMKELTEMNVRATTAWSAPPGTFGMTIGAPGGPGAGNR